MAEKLGNRRVSGDEQFYTPANLALELTGEALAQIPGWQERNFLEPAAGTGSFLQAMRLLGARDIIAIDKFPKHPDVLERDYLDFVPDATGLITLSNPPFGRNNALSIPFFNHAANHSDFIGFLVPRSWRKWSVQNRLDRRFELIFDRDVFVSYEDELGNPLTAKNELRTCFQIWKKSAGLRAPVLIPDNGFVAKTSPAEADVAIRVFGFGCGSVLWDFPKVPNTTLMFLKIQDPRAGELLAELDYQRFTKNTAYTEALAFTELNYLLNEQILGDGLAQKDG